MRKISRTFQTVLHVSDVEDNMKVVSFFITAFTRTAFQINLFSCTHLLLKCKQPHTLGKNETFGLYIFKKRTQINQTF